MQKTSSEEITFNKKKAYTRFGVFVVAAIVAVLWLRNAGAVEYVSGEAFQEAILSLGVLAPVVYGLVFTIAVIVYLPAFVFSIGAGVLFGPVIGFAISLVASTIGSILAFLISRYMGGAFMESLVKRRFKRLLKYNDKLEKHGLETVLALRLTPVFPYNAVNIALGFTKVRLDHFALATVLGIIPSTFAFVYFGNSVATLDFRQILVAIAILLLLLSGVGLLWRKRLKLKGDKEGDL